MKEDSKDFIIPVRVSLKEKNQIAAKAKKANLPISVIIRKSVLGCEVKEKPDERFYNETIKTMRDIEREIKRLGRQAHYANYIDEPKLERERKKWNEFMMEVKRKFL